MPTAMLTIPTIEPKENHSLFVIGYPYRREREREITPADEPMGVMFPPSPTPRARAHHKIPV